MLQRISVALVIGCFWIAGGAAQAMDRAAIKKRVNDAVALYEARGVARLCAVARDVDGPFLADEAYVFVYLRDGRLICHPRRDLNRLHRDRSHVPKIVRNTNARAVGAWTHYPWPHPKTLEIGLKSTFCRISRKLIICAGAILKRGLVS